MNLSTHHYLHDFNFFCTKQIFKILVLFLLFSIAGFTSHFAQSQDTLFIVSKDVQGKILPGVTVVVDGLPLLTNIEGATTMISPHNAQKPKKLVAYKKGFEISSWSYSDKVVEVLLNKKNYRFVYGIVENENGVSIQGTEVLVTDNKGMSFTRTTNQIGVFRLILPLEFQINSSTNYQIAGYTVLNTSFLENDTATVAIIKMKKIVADQPFNTFDQSHEAPHKLDDMALIKDFYLSDEVQDSLLLEADLSTNLEKMINDIGSDQQFLLKQNKWLERDITILNQKLEDFSELPTERKAHLIVQLQLLENMLMENELLFKSSFKGSMGAIDKLRESLKTREEMLIEVERENELAQKKFNYKLITGGLVMIVLIIVLTVYIILMQKLRHQKKELVQANQIISEVNASLEVKVANQTELLREAIKELDLFLYKSSHDLRRPLTTFLGLSSLIRLLSSDEKVSEILDKINMTATQMDLLLRKLIQVHQIMNGANYGQVDFKAMVLQLESEFEDRLKNAHAIIQLDFKSGEPLIADPEIMKIVLTYLLDNSLQYALPVNSRKLIVTIGYEVVDEKALITFHDNGLGMNPEIKEKAFDMFFIGNTNSKGNGLGLYVVKKGVERMDGEITLESIPDQYTRFVIKLPKHEIVPAALVNV